jgi:hypothetical protein
VPPLLFLNGYYMRGTSHICDQIVAYCETGQGVLLTLSFNFYVCQPVVLDLQYKMLNAIDTTSILVCYIFICGNVF